MSLPGNDHEGSVAETGVGTMTGVVQQEVAKLMEITTLAVAYLLLFSQALAQEWDQTDNSQEIEAERESSGLMNPYATEDPRDFWLQFLPPFRARIVKQRMDNARKMEKFWGRLYK
ncbi:uncharacterized protein LOC143038762 [Oratosquilla oratoria]|uniref:uncharacterized protein LOC143038762 n=1 Tax=Oratosquilla oratoria TaxID=337810 RepID=UPI003F75A5EC